MFLKTREMKKIMKASLKRYGLIVGNMDEHYLVYSDRWGVYVEHAFATNKFKAAIMELIGDLPELGGCYHYTIDADKELVSQMVMDVVEPYQSWMRAKDYGVITPMYLSVWSHEYIVVQRKSDHRFIVAPRSLTLDAISASELDTELEHMPDRPSILDGSVLYFKNESMIYWVHTESPGERSIEVLFPHLDGISFFESDWLKKEESGAGQEGEDVDRDDAAEEQIPY